MNLNLTDRKLAESFAGTGRDLASPAECAARTFRIADARVRMRTRLADLCAARELRRKHGVVTAAEAFTELNHLAACMEGCLAGSDLDSIKQRIADLCSEIEDEMMARSNFA